MIRKADHLLSESITKISQISNIQQNSNHYISLRKRNTGNGRNYLYECHKNIMNKYIPYTFSCMIRWIRKGVNS